MKLLVIDGNSILNRAYYGIRLLTTKDGKYTNGIYGFMNILLGMVDEYKPDNVAVAFDVHHPTFRHKMYDAYKGTRHPAPTELIEQFAPLKELLGYLGYKVVEKQGYEADDILGTLSQSISKDDFCYLLTGDRDSLQLVRDNVNVLLATTKMGKSETVIYDIPKVKEVYGVKPEELIDIKAIQGDTSDNIPGVAGIGEKGAKELIGKYHNIDYIYDNLDELDIKQGMKNKLIDSKDNAYLSRTLGTICLEAPIDRDMASYKIKEPDVVKASAMLQSLEMVKILKRLNFDESEAIDEEKAKTIKLLQGDYLELTNELNNIGKAFFIVKYNDCGIEYMLFKTPEGVKLIENNDFMFLDFVRSIFENKNIEKYTDDTKRLYSFCDSCGVELNNIKLDTSLAAYLLNPNSSDYSIDTLRVNYSLKNVIIEAGALEDFYKNEKVFVDNSAVIEALSNKLLSEITENSQLKLLEEIEIPLARVLASMEREGFLVDAEGIKAYGDKIGNKLEELLHKVYDLAGCEFNLNSPKQLGDVLFSEDKLNLPHKKKTKSGYSTNADVLESLRDKHPIINEILEYRGLAKLKSTYCDGLLKVIDNDGRIHSTLNQTETRTGRISSSEPNLQNIPVRTEQGRELRKFFIAKEGFTLIDADYSQIELRVLASLADDKNMIDAFLSGTDIHATTASQVMGIPVEEITPNERRKAKAVNFGIVYGISAFSLAQDIGVTQPEADRYIKGYLANYSGVANFMDNAKIIAKEKGYAETYFGRRRYLPELHESNFLRRSFAERVAMNMPIQGTAADIIKIAMIRVYERLKKECPEAHLIMQVHDELIIEAPEKDADNIKTLLKDTMESACKLSVPITADVQVGKTWYEAK